MKIKITIILLAFCFLIPVLASASSHGSYHSDNIVVIPAASPQTHVEAEPRETTSYRRIQVDFSDAWRDKSLKGEPTHTSTTEEHTPTQAETVSPVETRHHENTISDSSDDSPFAETLRRMQRRSSQRNAQAQQLGVTLPSQSGDIASVSPSLNRLNQAINQIMHTPSSF